MKNRYNARTIEKKWQDYWQKNNVFAHDQSIASSHKEDKKCYVLEMFPYPSGKIHMGHVRNYSIGDAMARFKKASGYDVLHPMGWDAFGMPAENAAMEHKTHPKGWTYKNIENMRAQFFKLGYAIDWSQEFATCAPEYYGQEQKLFIDFLENDLVYRKEGWVNWDPVDHTVLANEQVIDGKGWRSGAPVEKRKLSQWFLRITDFAQELLDELDNLHGWPERVRLMQKNWIGESQGAHISFPLVDQSTSIDVFTTRPDTLFGASFCALSAQHPLAEKWSHTNSELASFIKECQKQGTSEVDIEKAEKKGFDTGYQVVHPFDPTITLPVYIANFVLMEYGTGAIFACPAHDERDYAFAKKYNLPILPVVKPTSDENTTLPYTGDGTIVNSDFLNGLDITTAKKNAIQKLEELKTGKKQTTFRLRDWGVSRQRYWGCPIPIIHCDVCGAVPVPKSELPVLLPEDVSFDKPGNPLERHPTWKHTSCPKCQKPALRETDTFDTFFESSWYFLRFCSPHGEEPIDKTAVKKWMPVDHYIGGIEHAVMHLLYARFFTRALKKCGYVNIEEPFLNLMTQGMVCHETYQDQEGNWLYPEDVLWESKKPFKKGDHSPVHVGRVTKMSKSKKNVVDPEKILSAYGADTARLFTLSDTPVERDLEWSDSGIEGCWKFIHRLWRVVTDNLNSLSTLEDMKPENLSSPAQELRKKTHKTIQIVQQDFHHFRLNCAIARIREFANFIESYKADNKDWALREALETLVQLCNPITPHLTEELWSLLGHKKSLALTLWPQADPALAKDDCMTIAIQVKGKMRGTIEVPVETSQKNIEQQALSLDSVKRAIDQQTIKKVIYVPKRIINIVI